MDIITGISKLDAKKALQCLPTKKGEKGPKKYSSSSTPKLTIKTALLVQNDLSDEEDGELLVLAAVEEIVYEHSVFLKVELGKTLATLRVRSKKPECKS